MVNCLNQTGGCSVKKIKVFDLEYEIELVNPNSSELNNAMGYWNFCTKKIYISNEAAEDVRKNIIIHEIIHAILYQTELRKKISINEEIFNCNFTNALISTGLIKDIDFEEKDDNELKYDLIPLEDLLKNPLTGKPLDDGIRFCRKHKTEYHKNIGCLQCVSEIKEKPDGDDSLMTKATKERHYKEIRKQKAEAEGLKYCEKHDNEYHPSIKCVDCYDEACERGSNDSTTVS